MTDIFRSDSVETSYSTRLCRKCGIAMSMGTDARGRVWACPNCGRTVR